jgi:hypothetical protein
MSMWVVRAGEKGQSESKVLAEGIATMGYREMPDPSSFEDRDSMRKWYSQQYPNLLPGTVTREVAQIWDFAQNMKLDDFVILPCKMRPIVWIGQVGGEYQFGGGGADRHIRPVKWMTNIPRSKFDAKLSKKLDQHGTIYPLDVDTENAVKELLNSQEHLSQLLKELVLTYAKVAKKVANNTVRCPNIKFEHEIESKGALKSRFKEFLQDPTEEKFQNFWKRDYIWAATMGGNATNLIKKHNGLDAITEVLKKVDAATEYNPEWQTQLGASGALAEFWGKIKDQPIRNACANHGLVFFGMKNPSSYSDFLNEFKQFEGFYQATLGQEKVTQYPVEIELDQLFNFVDKATNSDLVVNPDIDDQDVKTLFTLKKQIDDLLRPSGGETVYWVEKRDTKNRPDLELGEYAVGKALLSGQSSKPDSRGHVRDIYSAMREVKPGDVVLHFIDNEAFLGVSIAESAVDDSFEWPPERDDPGGPGYLVRLKEYMPLDSPINKREFLEESHVFEQLSKIGEKYKKRKDYPGGVFYHVKDRRIGQGGYLTRAPPELVEILNNIYKQKVGRDRDLPHFHPQDLSSPIFHQSWIFQSVPERFNLLERLVRLGEEPWSATRLRDQMHVGDTVYYWQSGKGAGVYGIGTIVSPPQQGLDIGYGDWGVVTKIERSLVTQHIPKEEFLKNPVLRESTIIKSPQGTNFLLSKEEASEIKKLIPPSLSPTQVIFYGPPGTGKTYKGITRALEIIHEDPNYCSDPEKRPQFVEEFNEKQEEEQIEFITFHPSYSYEEFVEGIRPVLEDEGKTGNLGFVLKKGVFRNIVEKARAPQGRNKNFVLIIDEINRGNIPKVFGELITLIEEDKREGGKNPIQARLPYSGKPFIVPMNLHIIGTMNSADRSIALMDLALRRRFTFEPFMPEYEKTGLNDEKIDDLNLGALLRRLNLRIQALVDKDHQIGHSFFIKVKEAKDKKQELYNVWYNEIIPLLEEYFYNDYERLGYVLDPYKQAANTGFVEPTDPEIKHFLAKIDFDESEFPAGMIHRYESAQELVEALTSYAQ